jgi:alkanesulfonate monooxygenase SsuD/methylene tetrahydromethanopterin reductase-like flavin-dependent oxidoreductase (luciferase family)
VKTMIQMVPSMPVKSNEERRQLRPVGRNVEKYAEIIDGMVDIVKACDELGYWGMSFIEHHFHSEGFEMLPCPGIMNAWLGPYAKKMKMGQLGYVMATHNPLRVAEETALLDHILKGRFFVGFARGYQARWVRTLGQAYKSLPTLSNRESADQAEADENNQQIFREMVTIVKKAWTQQSFSHDSKFFEVPYPYEGMDNYPGYPCAREYGAPGEIDEQNRVRQISVVPAPYQKPHPQVFISSSGSADSARWSGEEGFTCCYFAPMQGARAQDIAYREGAAQVGKTLSPGQGQGLLRFLFVGKTREEAYEKVNKTIVPFFSQFAVNFFPVLLAEGKGSMLERVMNTGLIVAGTVDDVKQQIDEIYTEIPFEYFSLVAYNGLEPQEQLIEDVDLFATKIAPEFA